MKTTFLVMWLVLMVLTAGAVLADFQITESTATLEVDYAEFEEDDDFIEVPVTITIEDTDGTADVVNVAVTAKPSTYNVTPSTPNPVTIPADGSIPVTLTFQVPHEKKPGQEQIGTITVTDTANTTNTKTITLVQNTASMLVVKEISVDYVDKDGDSQDDRFDPEEDSAFSLDQEVRPGSEIEIKIEIENRF